VKEHSSTTLSPAELGSPLGSRVTLVQFSSAFCMPCKATRVLLQEISSNLPNVAHIEIDAESHLELVRKLNISSTPTTLILDSHGNEIGRAVGAPRRDQVLDAIAPISI
jgi:thiol-disulfide isomerase/thioredoxin